MNYPKGTEEISLIDLFFGIWERWKSIALTGLIGLTIAFLMVVGKEQKYQISVSVTPPTSSDIQSFLTASSLSKQPVAWTGSTSPWTPYISPPQKITPSEVYHVFEYNLISDVVQSQYLQHHDNAPRFEFTKSGRTITIFAYSNNTDSTLNLIHGYIEYASQHTIKNFTKGLADDIENRIIVGKHAENSLVKIFLRQQDDRITILKEALDIAKNIGATKPLEKVYSSSVNIPLYFRGTELLQAEINALQQRGESDAYFYVPQIREIQEWMRMLGDIKIDPTTISIAQTGSPKISKIGPSVARTLALGLIGGILLGLAIIFFSILLKQRIKP
jgi:LPS O-antigen subunit length determinant protein (WzzB/FepE family)